MDDGDFHVRIEDAINRADATMLSQAEREMDLKTFIREERIKSNRFLEGFERRTDKLVRESEAVRKESEDMRDEIRAHTAATWKMVDEMDRWRD